MKLYQRLGMLLAERVEDPARAIRAWEGALALDPQDLKARKSLERLYVDNQRWDDLESLYASQGAWSDLVRVFETMAGSDLEGPVRADLLMRAARLWRDRLEDLGRAERALDRIHTQIDGMHEGAAHIKATIYRATEDWEGLDGAYQILLEHREQPEERREIQRALALLREQRISDPEGAFAWWGQIVREDPSRAEDADQLERVAGLIDAWFSVVDLYRQGLEGSDQLEEDERVALRLRMGRVLADQMDSFEEALEQYRAILEDHPEHTGALGAMADIYERQGRWDELMEIHQRRLELIDEGPERVPVLHGIARIAEHQAQDPERALQTYLEAYELDPEDMETLAQLHRLYRDAGRFSDLADIARQEIALLDGRAAARAQNRQAPGPVVPDSLLPEDAAWSGRGIAPPDLDEVSAAFDDEEGAAPIAHEADTPRVYTEAELEELVILNAELGLIAKEELGEDAEALEALGRVIRMRPSYREALLAIEDYLRADAEVARRAAADLAEPVYQIYGRWSDLIGALEIQIATTEGEGARADLHERVAEIYLVELGMPRQAFTHYAEQLRLRPADEHARARLEQIADALGTWGELIALYEELLDAAGEPGEELRVDYQFKLAWMIAERAGDPDRARDVLYRILDARPDSGRALDTLEALFMRTGQWRDLLDVYERKLALAQGDAEAVRQMRFQIAALWEDQLEDRQEAIDILRAVLEEDPEDVEALEALARLYRAEQMWEELSEDLLRQLDLAPPAQRAGIKLRLGQVHQRQLGHWSTAVDLYEEVLGDHPEHAGAVEALEDVMIDPDSPVAERVSHILEPWYTERARWADLIEALRVQVEHAEGPEPKIELLHRVARIWEDELADPISAMGAYSRAFAVDVQHEPTRDQLYRIAEQTLEWDALVEVLEATAAETDEPMVKRELLRQAAGIYVDHIGDVDSTIDRLHDVIAVVPDDIETLEDLEEIHRQLQDWGNLVEVLRLKVDVVEDVDHKKELLYQAATIYEELDQPVEAIEIYNVLLGVDPTEMTALDRLEELYPRLERWVDLLDVYNRKLELAEHIESQKDLLYVIGGLHQNELDELVEAIDVYRRILELDPMELGALEKLDELYTATEQWHELLDTLEREIELTQMPEDQKTLTWRVGRLWEDHLGDGLRAVEVYQEVLQTDPAHEPSREALSRMILREEFAVEAAEVLRPIHEEAEEWDLLVEVLRALLTSTEDPERKLELLREIATIHEACREDKGSAFQALAEALAVRPGDEGLLDQLERLAEDLYAWDPYIDLLDELIEQTSDFVAAGVMQLRVARVYEERIQDIVAAIHRYERVLEQDPVDEDALPALDRLYQQQGHWFELAQILRTRIEQSTDPEPRRELRLRLGMLLREALEQIEDALDVYRAVLAEDPEQPAAIASLEEMFMAGQAAEPISEILQPHYLHRGEHDKLIELYRQRLTHLEDRHERHDLWVRIARLYTQELGQELEAIDPLTQAMIEDPADVELAEELERIGADHQQWPRVAQAYMTVLEEAQPEEVDALRLWLRLAHAIDAELGMPADAETAYLNALSLDPGQPDALAALDRIYQEQQSWEELAEILRKRIVESYQDDQLIELNTRLAQLYRDQLAEPEAAIECYRSVLAIDPVDQRALEDLEQLFLATQQFEELYENLRVQAEVATDPDRQADLCAQRAQIADEMLDRRGEAIELLERVVDLQPDNREALERLRRLYLGEERWEDMVRVIERMIDLIEADEEKLGLFENLGVIWGERLDDEVRALDSWQSALQIDPDYLPALEAMRDLHARRSDYFELSNTLSRMLEHPDLSEERKLELWIEQADIQGDMLMQPQEAIHAWRNVMMLDPGNSLAIESLERLYLQEGHWAEAVDVLDTKLDRVDEEAERLEIARQIAGLLEEQVGDRSRAVQYHQFVLELDPHDEDAFRSLEQILLDLGDAESLEELVNLYLIRASLFDDEPMHRLGILRRAAELFEQRLEQPESALLVLLSGLVPETVDQDDIIQEVERLARINPELWGEVLERYDAVLGQLDDQIKSFDVHTYAGRVLAEELDQPDDAIYHYQRALTLDDSSREVLERLEQLYQRVAAWPELAQTLHQRIELAEDPDICIQLWRKLGEIYESQLGDVDQAIASYEQILRIDEADLLAIESLERIHQTFERWRDLIDILRQKLGASFDPEELVEIRHRIAMIYEDQLDEPERAIGAYIDLLEVDQSHVPSLQSLERLYWEAEQWQDVLRVYERQLDVMFEPQDQVVIHGKMATIHEDQFQDMDAAVRDYNNVLAVDPSNETAIQNLERLYTTLEQWFDLVDVFEQHIQIAQDDATRVELLNEMARVYHQNVGDEHAAIEAFVRSLDIEPVQPQPMEDLGALYEITGNYEAAVETYDRLAEFSTDAEKQIELYARMGDLLEGQLMDDERAERAYVSALQIDPNHGPAIDAVRAIYERWEAWDRIIKVIKQAEDASRDMTEKARYMSQVGRLYDERMDDLVSALRYYEQAYEYDPDVVEAIEPLIDVYIREKRYERATPLLDRVLTHYQQQGAQDEAFHLRHLQMAHAAEELGLDEKALDHYYRAYEYGAQDLEGMLGLGRQLVRHEDLEAAFKIYQDVQLQHLDHLTGDQAAEVFFHSASIKERLGDRMRAIDYYEKVLDYQPDHKEALSSLLDNYEAAGEWDRFIDLSQQLLAVEDDDRVRFTKLARIGDIYAQQIQDPGMAVQAYLEALDIEPQSVVVLRKLLDLYTKTRQWLDAVEILKQLIALEDEPARQAKFFYTVGVIFRDEVHDPMAAVEHFDLALDVDVRMLKAFEAIDRILTQQKEWKELERAYRRMLKRVAEHQDDESMQSLYMMLWRNLGEIYRSRLGHVKSAIEAFRMASELDPNDEQIHLILAQLYARSGDGGDGLIEQHRALIEQNPFRIESYRALFKAYIQRKEYDKAWCMASALAFLQSASETEQKFYQQYLGKNLQPARATFNLEMFRKLYHPEQDMLTTVIMKQLYVAFAGSYARSHRDVGINKKKDQLDPNDKLLFCKIYSYAAGRLASVGLTPMPELYLRRDQAIGIRNANVMPPAFIVGADMFQGRDERELAFTIAKRLCWMLPEHYLGSCGYPTEWLKAFFMVALHITDPSLGLDKQIGPNAQSLIEAIQQAERQSPGLMVNIQKLARQFLNNNKNPNLSHWLTCVDHTTTRLGLLLCGDLHKAASCVKNDAIPVGKASVKEKIRELVLFSISEEYFHLRQQLGVAIGGQ